MVGENYVPAILSGLFILVASWIVFFGGYRWLCIAKKTLRRDLKALRLATFILPKLLLAKLKNETVVSMFRANVKNYPHKVMLIDCDSGATWTFKQVEERSNQIANYFLSEGYQKGDSVALFMENSPHYIIIWLGLAKIGVVSALINFNLKNQGLVHTIKLAKSRAIIFGSTLESKIFDIQEEICMTDQNASVKLYRSSSAEPKDANANEQGFIKEARDFNQVVDEHSISQEPQSVRLNGSDVLCYMYTSGTTGLPKAAVIKHRRQIAVSMALNGIVGFSPDEVVYTYLPLYHAIGLQLAMGITIFGGATNVVRKKFSASNFWKDCEKYRVSAAPYIGEIARYLSATPRGPHDTQHQVKTVFGNGLRPNIWPDFKKRFNIDRIVEIYGSTEGNAIMINFDNTVGAIGFTSVIVPQWIIELILPNAIVKVDNVTGELIRDPITGFCVKCGPDEPGELVAKVIRGNMVSDFGGYSCKDESSKKIANNVFAQGDVYFRSGDLLSQDELGYRYFKDRKGDTFRWQGENVSTAEVENVLSSSLGISELTCYGVEVPGYEGRAGMVALAVNEIDLEEVAKTVGRELPPYARPRFIRLTQTLDMTSTFKVLKTKLQQEGFDPRKTSDKIYYFDSRFSKYLLTTDESYSAISSGNMKI